MLKIGLTGGIGSGKTIVSKIFSTLGVPVYDADSRAKFLMHTHPSIRKALTEHFGSEVYLNDQLNRSYLAAVVFQDDRKLNLLNALVHPFTIQDSIQWFREQKGHYAIKEAALIFESGSDQFLDYVIGVTAPETLRIERVMKRDGIEAEKVLERINRQMDEKEKIKKCDFVIDNGGALPLIPQVYDLHTKLSHIALHRVL